MQNYGLGNKMKSSLPKTRTKSSRLKKFVVVKITLEIPGPPEAKMGLEKAREILLLKGELGLVRGYQV